PAVCALEDTRADHDISHIATHFTAEHDAAVPTPHRAVGDRDVFAGDPAFGPFCSGFDGDAIVPDVDVTVADAHIAAGLGVDAIGVRRIRRVLDADVADRDVVTQCRMNGPGRRVAQLQITDGDPVTLVQSDQRRARIRQVRSSRADGLPPPRTTTVDSAQSRDCHIDFSVSVDARRVDGSGDTFPARV